MAQKNKPPQQQLWLDMDMPERVKIAEMMHPEYLLKLPFWYKWRICYEGSDFFVQTYLRKFSKRESDLDFKNRMEISPSASFAKAAINDVKNSIYQRIADVTRKDGSQSYQDAVIGKGGGVDLTGSNMNYFIGRQVLPELLVQAKVGVFVDMPHIEPGSTMQDNAGKRPYLYMYRAEDIRSWTYKNEDDPTEFASVLLVETMTRTAPQVFLPIGVSRRFRHVWIGDDGYVWMTFYNENNDVINPFDGWRPDANIAPVRLNLKRIPFVVAELNDSLMADIANYQIALTNIESSDIAYILQSNVPFYIEQQDPNESSFNIPTGPDPGSTDHHADGSEAQVGSAKNKEFAFGGTRGRTYFENPPNFIAPPTEPLQASMMKQDKIKGDIRALINLNLSNIKSKVASAESKEYDERGLESGLSAIGLELEFLERKISIMWELYEGGKEATIKYPQKYSLKSDAERREEADSLAALKDKISSIKAKKALEKQIVDLLLANELSHDDLAAVHDEIDAAKYLSSAAADVQLDIASGILSNEGGALARGYPAGEAKRAADDHADRLARIADSQMAVDAANPGARGNPDAAGDPNGGKAEKTKANDTTTKGSVSKPDRGKGKAN